MVNHTRKLRLVTGTLAVSIVALLTTPAHNLVQAGESGCSVTTIAGTYGFALNGLVSGSFNGNPQRIGNFFPLTAVGTFSYDGHGTSSRSYTASFGGQIFPNTDSGPYTINSDCTGTATYSDGTWNFVIVGHGKEIKAMNVSPGVAVQGILTRE